jgi:hypothetical protein
MPIRGSQPPTVLDLPHRRVNVPRLASEEPIRRSALPGRPLHIPRLEMRSSPSAKPAGRRGAKHTSTVGQRAPRMRAGRPRSQGKTGADAPEDAELGLGVPRKAVAYPTVGDALGLERGARRATGSEAYVNRWPARTPDAGGTPALPGEDRRGRAGKCRAGARRSQGRPAYPTLGEALGLERGARRATGNEAYVKRWSARTRMRAGDARAPRKSPLRGFKKGRCRRDACAT